MELRFRRRLARGLDDVAGRGEVRLAGAEPDDRPAGRLQRLGFRVYGQGRGFGDGRHTGRYSRGWHASHRVITWRAVSNWFGVAAIPSVRFDGTGAFDVHSGDCNPEGSSSIGRVPVSKTGGWGFESLLPCQRRSVGPSGSAGLRVAIRLVLHR